MWAVAVAAVMLLAPVNVGASTHHARRMPDLVGLTRIQVFRIMRHDGLYFVTRGPGSAHENWRGVVAQSPGAGTVVAWHAQAILTVTVTSPRGPRAVPRLIGMSPAQTLRAMRAAQLYFSPFGPGSTTGKWGSVIAQSPRAGTLVAWHANVSVRVGPRRRARVLVAAPRHLVAAPATVVSGLNFKVGVATWYPYYAGQCATWYLPKGTRITVLDLSTGRSISCVITDREDHLGNHVVDLSAAQFSELASLSTGVIGVKVTW